MQATYYVHFSFFLFYRITQRIKTSDEVKVESGKSDRHHDHGSERRHKDKKKKKDKNKERERDETDASRVVENGESTSSKRHTHKHKDRTKDREKEVSDHAGQSSGPQPVLPGIKLKIKTLPPSPAAPPPIAPLKISLTQIGSGSDSNDARKRSRQESEGASGMGPASKMSRVLGTSLEAERQFFNSVGHNHVSSKATKKVSRSEFCCGESKTVVPNCVLFVN